MLLVKALQKVIANTILDRQLQQHLGREGFTVTQLDASFDRQAIFSSNNGAFSVDVSEVFEVSNQRVYASMLLSCSIGARTTLHVQPHGKVQGCLVYKESLVQSFMSV